ncbi:unnamed protein product [Lepidochelys olivacea]
MSGGKPLRLLGLHGYGQNQRSFHARTGALRKALRGRAELVTDADPRCWWFPRPREGALGAREEAAPCQGLEESLEAVAGAFAAHGPFDGLLGFSQGAALVARVCALKQRGDARFPFQFAVLVAGFESSGDREPIAVPSLHVLGDADRVIPPARSRELAARFVDPAVLTHPGGHFVPASAPQKRAYLEFLAKFLK